MLPSSNCKRIEHGGIAMLSQYDCILFSAETVLAYTAERADPVSRNIFPCCTRCYAVVRITDSRIINISAYITYILIHYTSLLDRSLLFKYYLKYANLLKRPPQLHGDPPGQPIAVIHHSTTVSLLLQAHQSPVSLSRRAFILLKSMLHSPPEIPIGISSSNEYCVGSSSSSKT